MYSIRFWDSSDLVLQVYNGKLLLDKLFVVLCPSPSSLSLPGQPDFILTSLTPVNIPGLHCQAVTEDLDTIPAHPAPPPPPPPPPPPSALWLLAPS